MISRYVCVNRSVCVDTKYKNLSDMQSEEYWYVIGIKMLKVDDMVARRARRNKKREEREE